MITFGPKLGLMVNGDPGEEHYEPLMAMLRAMDALIQPTVLSHQQDEPPPAAVDGECRIVGPAPGVGSPWEGQARKIARFNALTGGWEFYTPRPGWIAYSLEFGTHLRFRDGNWEPLVAGTAPPSNARLTRAVGTGYISGPTYNIGYSEENPFFLNYAMITGRSRNSGKRYFEMVLSGINPANDAIKLGVIAAAAPDDLAAVGFIVLSSYAGVYYQSNREVYGNAGVMLDSGEANVGALNAGNVLSVCVNIAIGRMWYRINGAGPWYGGGDPGANTGGFEIGTTGSPLVPFFLANEAARSVTMRSAAGDFTYALPSGAVAWDA